MRINKRVEQSLEYNPELRDSDLKLILHEWKKDGLELTEQQERIILSKCTTPETITRARRALRSKYPGSEQIEQKRFELFQEKRNEYSNVRFY